MTPSVVLWMTVVCTCVTGVFAKSFFTRNARLDNRRVCDSPLETLMSVPLDQCARLCHNNSSCSSIVHNNNYGTCELFSGIHVDPEDASPEAGNLDFWKRDGFCDVPNIANGKVLHINSQVEGSKAEFVCDDFYIPTIEAVICDITGAWVDVNTACQHKLNVPYLMPAKGKIKPDSCVVVVATPTNNTHFNIDLRENAQNVHLHISVRFVWFGSTEILACNSLTDGTWGSEEQNRPYWVFEVNQEFNMTICAEETMYRGYVDNTEMFTYIYRRSVSAITALQVAGDVVLRSLRFVDAC